MLLFNFTVVNLQICGFAAEAGCFEFSQPTVGEHAGLFYPIPFQYLQGALRPATENVPQLSHTHKCTNTHTLALSLSLETGKGQPCQ